MAADLTAYVPRLLLQWDERFGSDSHQAIVGTLVFADVSGFTKLSEALARKGGKIGAEQMADVINGLFGELLLLAAARGGEMLKYGGDAMLLFFEGDDHAIRGTAACYEMQKRLHEIGRVDTGAGTVRLRMSVGVHSGTFDFFVGGRVHRELVVAGPDTSVTVAMEAAAQATEVLMSSATAAQLPRRHLGAARAEGCLLRGYPSAPFVETVPVGDGHDASRYLTDVLVEHLAVAQHQPTHRLATVSFLQFMDLDRLLIADRAQEAATRLDDVLTLVQECYARYGVTFLATDLAADGGKVMAACGAPVAYEDHEERTLLAARAVLDGGPALPVRIGINRGHVFAGDVGPSFRRTYTSLGDVTNTAARVMGQATRGQCLALAPVLDAAASEWSAEELEPFVAKGKSDPLVPWLVGRPGRRRARHSTTPLIGREVELERLVRELDASLHGVRTFTVTGEPGLGKSRLVAELTSKALAEGRAVLSVSCDPHTATTPYHGVGVLVTEATGVLDGEALRSLVDARVPSLADELPLVGLALGLDLLATPATEHLDDSVLPDRIANATAILLSHLIPSSAVVLVEDGHWMDAPSVSVLEALRTTRREGLLFGTTRRDGEGGWLVPDADCVVALAPLGAEAAVALVEAASSRPLLPDDARRLAERAAGNPLFAEQLAVAPEYDDLPDSVEELLATRIDQLSGDAQDPLRQLSVLGPSFDVGLAEAVVGALRALPTSLDLFLVRDGSTIRFTHALLQQVAYAGLTYRRRRELHRQVAGHLIDAGAADERVEELSMHCDAGAMWSEARQYASEAARSAEARYAFGIAATHWERVARVTRQLPDSSAAEVADIWYACGEAHRRAGRLGDAQRSYRAGRKVAPAGSAQAVTLATSIGRSLLHEGQLRRASEWARKAGREAEAGAPLSFAVEASVDELRADIAEQAGHSAYLLDLARTLAARARRHHDVRTEALAQCHVFLAATSLGLAESGAEGMKAKELAERWGNVRMQVSVLSNLGEAATTAGDWARATHLFSEASQLADIAGFALGRVVIDNNAAEILVDQGRLEEARALFTRARSTALASGHWYAAYLEANVGWVHGLQGCPGLARQCLDEASRQFRALGLTSMLPEVDRRRVMVALVQGDGEAALRLLGSASGAAEASDPALLACRSHAHRQLHQFGEAQAAAVRAKTAADGLGNAFGRLVAAEALWRLGDTEQASVIATSTETLGIVARPLIP